jgi:hypothetical protein
MNGHRSTDDRIGNWVPMGAYASKECTMTTITELPQLPLMPAGIVIPDTVEEMFHDEKVIVTIVGKWCFRMRVLGCGRGNLRNKKISAWVPISKDGTAENWRIIFPEHLRCEGTFDDGPRVVRNGDAVTLTLRFP